MPEPRTASTNFIRVMVERDMQSGKYQGRVVTRFPPEPNGFLHIGHAKSICLNFGLALEHGGVCHLRFDDTNPANEDIRYAESIKADIQWLGFDWGDHLFFASDYFEALYDYATILILEEKAYVDSLSEAQIREYRGTVTEPGRESPYRNRSVDENLDLFERMKAGEFENGAHVLRARIDMAAPNMLMRDPLLYRIRHVRHYRRGNDWCIYPMYDFAHCLSDAIEQVTHSLCSLEFKDNRPLYDWVLEAVSVPSPRPEQTEFARLILDYTVLSKRKLIQLVQGSFVDGWDDPRMPTIAGLRRRGVRPDALRDFCELIGVARVDSRVDVEKLEHCIRDDLNQVVPRVMCVLRPLRVELINFPEGEAEWLEAPHYPHDVPKEGARPIPFSRTLYIEREDFAEDPPPGFKRLAPGWEVRLRYGYIIKCDEVIKEPETGDVVKLRCAYDPATRGGSTPDGRTVKGTIHWVSADHGLPATVRLYDRLFRVPDPDDIPEDRSFIDYLNPDSLVTLRDAVIEPSVREDPSGSLYQFERQGYFVSDIVESAPDTLVFNRTVGLRDTWGRSGDSSRKRSETTTSKRKLKERHTERKRDAEARVKERGGDPDLNERFERYRDVYGLSSDDAELLSRGWEVSNFFENAIAAHDSPGAIANWMVNDVMRVLKTQSFDELPFGAADLGKLVSLIEDGTLSSRAARDVFEEMAGGRGSPGQIVGRLGLEQISDEPTVGEFVRTVLDAHPNEVVALRSGRDALHGFFVGQIMKASGGKANPAVVRRVLEKQIEESRPGQ
jgi:glutaminyl-tRNA synthetase